MSHERGIPFHGNEPTESSAPTLGDVLQLEAAIEANATERTSETKKSRVIYLSPTEAVEVSYFPKGRRFEEGNQISQLYFSQRMPNGSYEGVMTYTVFQDGDEGTTRVVKRPYFKLPTPQELMQDPDAILKKTFERSDKYKEAERLGLFDVTQNEIQDLSKLLVQKMPNK